MSVLKLNLFRTAWVGILCMGLSLLLFMSTGQAAKKGDVRAELTAYKVVLKADGTETLQDASVVRPGDLVEYQTNYRNSGKTSVTNVLATLPVPKGMTYQPQTATPAITAASVDGKTFAPVPLMRMVRLSDGTLVQRQVPHREYRFLRWRLDTLEAGTHVVVQARMRLAPVGGAVPAN